MGPLAVVSLDIVGLDVGSMEALGRPMILFENTEKNGLAQGTVAEMTLTWQASSDITWRRTTEAVGLGSCMFACKGPSLVALGGINSRRSAKAMTTLAFVLKGMVMSQTMWIVPASMANSKIQEETAVASLWPHYSGSTASIIWA